MTFLTNLEATRILCNFRIIVEVIAGRDMSESSRLEFSVFKRSQQTILLYKM